ncbi:hypothetical protein PIB30_075931 [Stylosanthes scabra]|uniref:Uncharacterized protein n=1 Tax=Stylosanthes scabra TaxID=79078 RepID=A0ABU6WTJ4_9FABA|nr:hypothetical protein [Stylosanthes scabra]
MGLIAIVLLNDKIKRPVLPDLRNSVISGFCTWMALIPDVPKWIKEGKGKAEVVIATSIAASEVTFVASHSVSRLTLSSSEKHHPQPPSPLPILTSPSRRHRRSSPHHRYCPKNLIALPALAGYFAMLD